MKILPESFNVICLSSNNEIIDVWYDDHLKSLVTTFLKQPVDTRF